MSDVRNFPPPPPPPPEPEGPSDRMRLAWQLHENGIPCMPFNGLP